MKLGLPEHTCKFFTSPHRNRRYCKQCHKVQYNYSGTWEDEISFQQFTKKYTRSMGSGTADFRLEAGTDFEYDCYETWGVFYDLSIREGDGWKYLGRSPNLNAAERLILKATDKS